MKRLQCFMKSLVLISLLTLFPGCAATQGPSTGAGADDSVITRNVSAALFQEPSLRTAQINVKTRSGVVKLTGVVEKALHVETAKQVAGSVPGVVEVQAELAVKE